MARWYEHPCSSKLLEGEQILNILPLLNEAKESFKNHYGDINSKISPLEDIIKMWPDKSSVKKEWLRKVIDNGPMNDKMQSMVTVISMFPMHSFYYLDHLISHVNMNKKRFAIKASELLTNLFIKYLLPPLRPLLNMKERPLASLDKVNDDKAKRKQKNGIPGKEKIMCYWYYEEQLKTRYIRFLKAMEEILKNETDKNNKLKMISLFSQMCVKKESQSLIIDILINKLGDNDKKVVGSSLSKLSDLGKEHSSLVPMIVRSVRKFIFRPNLTTTAQYYAMQLLVRTKFDSKRLESAPMEPDEEDPETHSTNLPIQVIQIYIGVLKRLMEASKTKCEKLYSAIMCGISRALPYAKSCEVNKYTDSVFKLVHSSNLNLSIQGLKVLFVIVSTNQANGAEDTQKNFDRYQRLVYRTLTNPSVMSNCHKTKLVEIFFKSVAIDEDLSRAKTMVKRLLQLCIQIGDAGFICVCLMFLSRLMKSKLSGIFKMRSVAPQSKVKEDLKMPTINNVGDDVVACQKDDDSGDEVMPDVISDDEGDIDEVKAEAPVSSWVHIENIKLNNKTVHYDPFSIDPKFSNVDREELIELKMLRNHTHPTVKLFVENILKMEPIVYKSDPSEDFSLGKFLDRFAFRNPKEIKDKRKLIHGTMKSSIDPARKLTVNSQKFVDLDQSSVPIDELFFHNYFNHAKKTTKKKESTKDEDFDDDFDDVSDTAFDDLEKNENDDDDDDDDFSFDDDDFSFDDDDFSFDDDVDDDEEDVSDTAFDDLEKRENDDDSESDDDNEFDDDNTGNDFSDEEEEEEEESSDEDATIHSSKRRKLGAELSSITTGAMATGKVFEGVKAKYEVKRKHDRKVRKSQKPKKVKKEQGKTKQQKSRKRKHKK